MDARLAEVVGLKTTDSDAQGAARAGKQTNVRLSRTAQDLLTKLQEHYGLSQTALFEFLLREENRRVSQVPQAPTAQGRRPEDDRLRFTWPSPEVTEDDMLDLDIRSLRQTQRPAYLPAPVADGGVTLVKHIEVNTEHQSALGRRDYRARDPLRQTAIRR